jgi:hypothetical protein
VGEEAPDVTTYYVGKTDRTKWGRERQPRFHLFPTCGPMRTSYPDPAPVRYGVLQRPLCRRCLERKAAQEDAKARWRKSTKAK